MQKLKKKQREREWDPREEGRASPEGAWHRRRLRSSGPATPSPPSTASPNLARAQPPPPRRRSVAVAPHPICVAVADWWKGGAECAQRKRSRSPLPNLRRQ
ncbi:uncharacterized protein DS421_16g540750 [Arachis hypogaea]|nr:uncharacterized protein DS421_16g540750 [Arachis hypogaea]